MCNDFVDMHKAQQWLLSPLAIIDAGLLPAQIVGLGLQKKSAPKFVWRGHRRIDLGR